MGMYTNNPGIGKVRAHAVHLVREGWSSREVARHLGYDQSAIVRWVSRAPGDLRRGIPTRSSRPCHHPDEVPHELVLHILALQEEYKRGAQFLWYLLEREGVELSLSSVKRILRRHGVNRYSKWKKWRQYPPRPVPTGPGILVEADTVHRGREDKLYVYTLLDVCSRMAHAVPTERISAVKSVRFVVAAQERLTFPFVTIQTDNGPEFGKHLSRELGVRGIAHRHNHVRKPQENGHLERWNRTIQEECLDRIPQSLQSYRREIPQYLHYYNTERPHLGLGGATPLEVMRRY